MANTATPMGAEPVGALSSKGSFAHETRQYKIASGYGTAIFYGDFVKPVAAGTVEKDAGTSSMTPIGIFMGCSYTDPNTNQLTHSQQWPASTSASDAVAYVLVDPDVLFQMQADESVAQTALFANAPVVQTAGDTNIGRSKNAVDGGSIATTNSLPLRIVDFVDGPFSAAGDSFTDLICKFNAGHALRNTTGV